MKLMNFVIPDRHFKTGMHAVVHETLKLSTEDELQAPHRNKESIS
jgi:hypothetical protein